MLCPSPMKHQRKHQLPVAQPLLALGFFARRRGQGRVERARMSTQPEIWPCNLLAHVFFSCGAIAGCGARWYPVNRMRNKDRTRVARRFCKISYRCIHETVHQLQEPRARQISRKGSRALREQTESSFKEL